MDSNSIIQTSVGSWMVSTSWLNDFLPVKLPNPNILTIQRATGTFYPYDGSKSVTIVADKNFVGLDQVDNTSDIHKPISMAQQEAIDGKGDNLIYSNNELQLTSNGVAIGDSISINAGGNMTNYYTKSELNHVLYNTRLNLGTETEVGSYSIAVGFNARASSQNAISIGDHVSANYYGIAIGSNSIANMARSIAIGETVSAGLCSAIAIGDRTTAAGLQSIAIGSFAVCSEDSSVSIGASAQANLYGGMALGKNTISNGSNSIALGYQAITNSDSSVAVGRDSMVRGDYGIAVGTGANATGGSSIAMGVSAIASGVASIALGGQSSASGNESVALGRYANAAADYSTALGHNAIVSTTNTIQLGNATTLSTLSSRVVLTVTSDERDKTDIKPLSKALEFINKVEPIQYVANEREKYNVNEKELSTQEVKKRARYGLYGYDKEEHEKGTKKGERKRVGFRAQQVQKVIEELYKTDNYADIVNINLYDEKKLPKGVEDKYSIGYEKFIPFLVQAIQELTERLEKVEEKM